jgi:hypothetical protein
MEPFTIDLTSSEHELLEQITLDQSVLIERHNFDSTRQNGIVVLELMKSLIARKAIPERRILYFTDPAYNPGSRRASIKDRFEKSGTMGEEIFRHPNFLEYLQYFLFGSQLPHKALEHFCRAVSACGNVTSGDIAPLSKLARALTRSNGLPPFEAAEEFYRLSLDCGISQMYAEAIYRSVKQVR